MARDRLREARADLRGDLQEALEHHRASLTCFERAGDVRGACQTLSNVGFILLGVLTGTEAGYRAAMFYTLSYVIMAAGSFGMILLPAMMKPAPTPLATSPALHGSR